MSTISGFSSFGVFFLGLVRQYNSCGQGAHVTCPFIPLLAAESGGQDFVPLRGKANYILATFESAVSSIVSTISVIDKILADRNPKRPSQECLKDYPSAMLSSSAFREWNGTTVTLHMETSLPFSLW